MSTFADRIGKQLNGKKAHGHGRLAGPRAQRERGESCQARVDWPGDHAAGDLANTAGWQSFPLDTLPEPVRGFIAQGADAIGCDAAFLALPLLTALGAAIGNTRRVALRQHWSEPPLLWTVIVGESGTQKSPAFELATAFFRERQALAFANHHRALENWKIAKEAEAEAGPKPICQRIVIADVTLEALAGRLKDAPRGLLLARDELAAAWSKLEGYCGRLALILHLRRWAAGDATAEPFQIDAASVDAAAVLVRWFGRETERVYGVLRENEKEDEERKIVDWIRTRGSTTVRAFQRTFSGRYPTAALAEAALYALVTAGRLRCEVQPGGQQGGKPVTSFLACP